MIKRLLIGVITIVVIVFILLIVIGPHFGTSGKILITNETWGGKGIEIDIGTNSSTVKVLCLRSGSIDEPFSINKDGTFDLAGTYSFYFHSLYGTSTIYAGRIDGNTMYLSIQEASHPTTTDTEVLTLNSTMDTSGMLRICPP